MGTKKAGTAGTKKASKKSAAKKAAKHAAAEKAAKEAKAARKPTPPSAPKPKKAMSRDAALRLVKSKRRTVVHSKKRLDAGRATLKELKAAHALAVEEDDKFRDELVEGQGVLPLE